MTAMTSMQRVLTTLQGKEPDRVPFFLLLTMHGAKELGLSIEEYFSKAGNVVEGQWRLREKYKHDCLYGFFYAAVEVEAWGCDVIYYKDGPPNSGRSFLNDPEQIPELEAPRIEESPCLQKVLEAITGLKARAGDEVPVIGVVMSPFSLPVMQLGFGPYIELIYRRRDLFEQLMAVNERFCVQWANAQLHAGAAAICYYDPISSPSIVPSGLYRDTGYEVARRTLAQINGPTATHFASGRCLSILDEVVATGTQLVGFSTLEDPAVLKTAGRNRLTIMGNLDGIKMRTWNEKHTEEIVRDIMNKAAPGGGFILSDNHGEIPFQVSDDVLRTISQTVHRWGRYPLQGKSVQL